MGNIARHALSARLAQLVERQPFKLVVVGSSPTVGAIFRSEGGNQAQPFWCGLFRLRSPHGVMDNALDF